MSDLAAESHFYPDCPPEAHGGNYSCDACLAVVSWEGELPDTCLKCGAPLTGPRSSRSEAIEEALRVG